MLMPESEPKTLFAAKAERKQLLAEIHSLRAKLGYSLPAGTEPIPKEDPMPTATNPVAPPIPNLDLSSMAPRQFEDFVQRCGTKELKNLLSRETAKRAKLQDDSVVSRLYSELKRRRA
jgi:hypothetical protein